MVSDVDKEKDSIKVIDFHVHTGTWEMNTPGAREFMLRFYPDAEAHHRQLQDPLWYRDYLAGQGVHYAVVLAEHAPATSSYCPSEWVADYCRDIEMFIPFASLDPHSDAEPASKLEFYVKELGMRGLKLLPSYCFFSPNDAVIYPVYEKAQELDIPVVFHTGSSLIPGTKMRYADPLLLDDVAVDFPKLRIVMAHAGRGFWYDRAFFLSRLHQNLFMDITGLPPGKLLDYFPDLERNSEKILFGSDWPAAPKEIKSNVQAICDLPLNDATIENILYRNAERILFWEGL